MAYIGTPPVPAMFAIANLTTTYIMEELTTKYIGRHEVITSIPNDRRIRQVVYDSGKSATNRITQMYDDVSITHNQAKGEWCILLYQGVYISLKPTIVHRHVRHSLMSMHDDVMVCKHVPFLHIRNKCIAVTPAQVRGLLNTIMGDDE